jgi:molecular chaperone GrpE (heat shock protein)
MTKPEGSEDEGPAEAPDRSSLLRALRDLEATQARVQQNAGRVYDDMRRGLVLELLPVLDNLERTLAAAAAASDPALVTGLRMVLAGLEGVLVRYGVERVDAGSGRFDPAVHEAVAAIPVSDPKLVGSIMQQAAPGYRFGGKMLRAAKVGVGVLSPAVHAPRPRDFRRH